MLPCGSIQLCSFLIRYALCGFSRGEETITQEKGNESVKKRKSVPIFKGDRIGRNLNCLMILISCKKAIDKA